LDKFRTIADDLDGYLSKVDQLMEGINFLVKSKLKSGEKVISQLVKFQEFFLDQLTLINIFPNKIII